MTYDHAINSVQEGAYRSATETDLREMLRACMDIHGANLTALHRINQAAEILRGELASRFLSGERTWLALKCAIHALESVAPKDHDVIIQVGGLSVHKARFIEPHSFLFEGVNQNSHRGAIVIHFSQLNASIVFVPQQGPSRVVTGFADGRAD